MALSADTHERFVVIVDSILSSSDLSTISEKRIRKGIQERVGYDITPHKAAIQELIMQRFDVFYARQNPEPEPEPIPSVETGEPTSTIPLTNGKHSESDSRSITPGALPANDVDVVDVADNLPPKKKRKTSVDEDAAFAARLQAEEDKLARPTRTGASRKAAPVKKKTPKKKTQAKVTGSDDSELDDEEHSKRKVNRDTGFHKPLNLSPALADLFGEPALSRPQVTKRIWQYIKSKDLQDPGDKRFIICDDRLRDILKQDKVHMFTMTKLLSQQMYNPDE